MKPKKTYGFECRILSLLFLACLTCCHSSPDDYGGTAGTMQEGVRVPVSFAAIVPGQSYTATRAFSETDETLVAQADILVFDESGGFLYRARTTDPVNSGNTKTFDADLFSSEAQRSIHLIANARSQVDALTIAKGDSEATVLSQLEAQVTSSPALAMKHPFVMWGCKTVTSIPTTGLPAENDRKFHLLRGVARVDIGLNYQNGGSGLHPASSSLPDFKLTYAQVYGAPERGRVVPGEERLSPDRLRVETPTPVSGSNAAVNYDGITGSPTEHAIAGSIYLFEKEVSGSSDCINMVIGGIYGTDTQTTFYRIELRDGTPENKHLSILRNHLYRINITRVEGRGHATIREALDNLPIGDLRANITVEETGMTETVYDEQHFLSVTASSFDFYREQKTSTLNVVTNAGDGFEITDIPAWLTLSRTSGPAGSSVVVTLTPDTYPLAVSGGQDRSAVLSIRAGRLQKNITVTQSYLPELTLEVEPQSMVFFQNGLPQTGGTTSIAVTTFSNQPELEVLTFEIVPGGSWSASADFEIFPPPRVNGVPGTGASGTYNLKPGPGGPVKEGLVRLTLSYNNNERQISREINVRQLNINSLFLPSANNPYPAVGGTDLKYTVVSELAWKPRLANPSNPMFSAFDQSEHTDPISEGSFSLVANNSYISRSEWIKFDSPTGEPSFSPVDLLIEQAGDPLHITFTEPADRLLDLGLTGEPRPVKFRVNSNWALKDFKDPEGLIVSKKFNGADLQLLPHVYAGGSPNNGLTLEFSIVGRVMPEFPPYTHNTRLGASIVFVTRDTPPGITPLEVQFDFLQIAPPSYEFSRVEPAAGSTLPATGASVTVWARANNNWLGLCDLAPTSTVTKLIYNNLDYQPLAVPVPDNPTNAARNFTIMTWDQKTQVWTPRGSFIQAAAP